MQHLKEFLIDEIIFKIKKPTRVGFFIFYFTNKFYIPRITKQLFAASTNGVK